MLNVFDIKYSRMGATHRLVVNLDHIACVRYRGYYLSLIFTDNRSQLVDSKDDTMDIFRDLSRAMWAHNRTCYEFSDHNITMCLDKIKAVETILDYDPLSPNQGTKLAILTTGNSDAAVTLQMSSYEIAEMFVNEFLQAAVEINESGR